MSAARLIIAIGNPSRGDDALGPTCLDHLQDLALPGVELLTDFQLQVEHALDLAGRDTVIFIDASVSAEAPFAWQAIEPKRDTSHSSHALSPQMLLFACGQIGVELPPRIYQLAIRGYQFELGDNLSPAAHANLEKATRFLVEWLSTPASHA